MLRRGLWPCVNNQQLPKMRDVFMQNLQDRKAGNGGGGSFVEIILSVNPGDQLELVVGSGGGKGVFGGLVSTCGRYSSRRACLQ